MVRLLGAGDNVVDRYTDQGVECPGGNAVNVAVHAGRVGADAAYLGRLGDDARGALVMQALREEGVDTSFVEVVPGPNAYATIGHRHGDRVFLDSNRGVAEFEFDNAHFATMTRFDAVHTAYTGTLLPHVARIAAVSRVSYDFADRHAPYGDAVRAAAPHLYLASFSGSHLGAAEIEQHVRALRELGARHVLFTRGADGAILGTPDGLHRVDATPVEVTDTLGAGDAFIAVTLVGLLRGEHPAQTLSRAAAVAAQVCTHLGGFRRSVGTAAALTTERPRRES